MDQGITINYIEVIGGAVPFEMVRVPVAPLN
jgi:hypothetical protein